MNNLYYTFLLLLSILISSCNYELPEDVETAFARLPEKVEYNLHVKPILSDRCFSCHGNDDEKRKADLRLDIEAEAFAALSSETGRFALVKGNPDASEVFHRILSDDEDFAMPPAESKLVLSAMEKATIVKWIDDGAEYQSHWSLTSPAIHDVPSQEEDNWCTNFIDNFILEKLMQANVQPVEEATKEILLRRLCLDLTGLPPTTEDRKFFLENSSDQAYDQLVDRLLESPHYGERMATPWLDLARFADTHGYTVDRARDMTPWRDWVIDAFNQNMPYDDFVTWQLAGDLLPNATREQILATGFNRNHQQNMEGGIVEEEFRVEYVADRTNTFGTAFLGQSVACAKCHDHKFDPISQKEYFELFSFFNNVREAGQISYNNAMPVPTMLMTTEEVDSIEVFIANQRESIYQQEIEINYEAEFDAWLDDERSKLSLPDIPKGAVALFDFTNESLVNRLDRKYEAEMKQDHAGKINPIFSDGYADEGLKLNGDAYLSLAELGAYDRHEAFTVGIKIFIPRELDDGVIFHKGEGAALYNFRGYHLAIKENKFEVTLAHTHPYNTIIEYSTEEVPKDKWLDVMMTYDGLGTSDGLKLFLDGREIETIVDIDNLYKTILFNKEKETGLSIGARYRGKGIGNSSVDDIIIVDRNLSALEVLHYSNQELGEKLLSLSSSELDKSQKDDLKDHYLNVVNANYQKHIEELNEDYKMLCAHQDTTQEVMIIEEMKSPRQTFVLNRGIYNDYGEEVFPNTPESILPFDDELPKNRLGLAKWLFQKEHPLTSRVAVNRMWQQFFGKGLVPSSDDFGAQGSMPTHPKLLDNLAIYFMESDWDIKQLVKLMVMSSTYRQASLGNDEMLASDPDNLLYARGPSERLSAELMRDNVLAASGLLNRDIGGKSVMPYQPDGLWRVNGGNYKTSTGKDLYKRSMYTFWKRSVPHPTLATFDAPGRNECTIKRQKTSTPLQALVLMNDPTYNEAAKVLGAKISKSENTNAAISQVFFDLTGRAPQQEELDILLRAREKELRKFESDPDRMKGWLAAGEKLLASNDDLPNLAANAVIASTIINSDASTYKR